MKNDRLFQLLYLLLEGGQTTAPALAERLEVSVRTIYRDVEALSMAGVPVYATAGKGGGVALLPGYTVDRTLLSDSEQDQLLFAVQSLQAADQQVDGLLRKLGSTFRRTAADWIAVDFSRWGLQRTDSARFEQMKTAIIGKQVLSLTYCSSMGEITERQIHPVRLVYKDKHWYLQGYCLRADDFRLFKVGRIITLTTTGERFAADYRDQLPPLESEAPPIGCAELRLRFSRSVAFRVYDEFDHQNIHPDGDSLLVDTCFPLDDWVVGYLFSFGTDVTVLQPPLLREQLSDYARKIAEHHKT